MAGVINSITSPLGVKLFKGGPYPDAGIGDQQGDLAKKGEANAAQYMAQLAPIIAQIAQAAGVANPLEKGSTGQFDKDPYGLSPLQQAAANQEQGITADSYDQIMSKVKANLSARGLGGSDVVTAAEAYLQKQMQGQLGQERVAAGENAYQNRQAAQQQIAQLLGSGYGAQQGALGNTQNVLESQKQAAIQSHQASMQQLGSLLALGLYGGKVGPFGAQKAGAGSGGNVNMGWDPSNNMFGGTGGMGANPGATSGSGYLGDINWQSIYG